ncbi:uncharacterized protein LOC144136542 isoform X2 [Amblyomma americanum]
MEVSAVPCSISARTKAMHSLPMLPAAPPAALATVATFTKAPRVAWSDLETMVLIDLWEKHFDDLRRQKRNGAIYLEIARSLRASGYMKNKKQVHSKIENMTQMYRKWTKQGVTQSNMPSWPFYWAIHRFMRKVKPKPTSSSSYQAQVTSTIPALGGQEPQNYDNDEVGLPDLSEPQQSSPAGAQLSAEGAQALVDARVKLEQAEEAHIEDVDAAMSDASSETMPWPAQQETNSDALADLGHLHEPSVPFTSQLIEPASLSTSEVLEKMLDEQKQLRRSIEESNRRRYELLLRQTRLQERATEALVQIAAAIKSCIKAPLSSP